jgi:hypothetical protein
MLGCALVLHVGKTMTYPVCEFVIPANAGIHRDFGMSIFKWSAPGGGGGGAKKKKKIY